MQPLIFRGLIFLAISAGKLSAAVPGAWEQFPTMKNAFAWRVYDYADGGAYLPEWDSSVAGQEYIWLRHQGDEPLEFSADAMVGQGALVGNYADANVKEVSCEVLIESIADFSSLDCSVLTKAADGVERWYYSNPYVKSDFSRDGWWRVRFGFRERWSFHNGTTTVEVTPDASFQASIREVSVTFFPRVGTALNHKAAIDNFILEPELILPELITSVAVDGFRIAFTPAPGLSEVLEKLSPTSPYLWSPVVGQADIRGPGLHVFSTAIDSPVKIYRAMVAQEYEPFLTP